VHLFFGSISNLIIDIPREFRYRLGELAKSSLGVRIFSSLEEAEKAFAYAQRQTWILALIIATMYLIRDNSIMLYLG